MPTPKNGGFGGFGVRGSSKGQWKGKEALLREAAARASNEAVLASAKKRVADDALKVGDKVEAHWPIDADNL
jgi:hypothetical protein